MVKRSLFLLTVFTLLVSAPVFAQTPGVTDTEVVIGITTPLSGPAALWGTTGLAMEAWTKYVNEQGGIHGRKLRVVIKDDGYNPGRAVANLKELKDTFMSLGLLGSAIVNAAKDEVAESKTLVINPYGNPAIWARQPKDKIRYVFVNYPDYQDEAEFLVAYAGNRIGAKKVAVFHQNDDYGKGGLEGVNRGLKSLTGKTTLAAAVPYEVSDRELGTHALKLKDSGADAVILYATPTHGANIVREMAKVGYRPRIVASFPLGDYPTMFKLAGELWEGVYFAGLGSTVRDPDGKKVADILTKYEPKIAGKENTGLSGATAIILALEGLKKAGRNLTKESYVEGMESIKNFTTMGLTGPVTFGPNRRHGLNSVRLLQAGKASENSYTEVMPYQVFQPHF